MTAAIVLPSLTNWTKNHLTAILEATTSASLNDSFDAFFSKNATISSNGKTVSHEEYKSQLQGEKFDEVAASVAYIGSVEVPADDKNRIEAGSVGVFYTATISEAIVIRDAPVQHQVTSSVNVVIEQDLSLPAPHPGPIRGFSDRRRVVALNQVVTNAGVSNNA